MRAISNNTTIALYLVIFAIPTASDADTLKLRHRFVCGNTQMSLRVQSLTVAAWSPCAWHIIRYGHGYISDGGGLHKC